MAIRRGKQPPSLNVELASGRSNAGVWRLVFKLILSAWTRFISATATKMAHSLSAATTMATYLGTASQWFGRGIVVGMGG